MVYISISFFHIFFIYFSRQKDESSTSVAVCDLTTSSVGSSASNPDLESVKPVEEVAPVETNQDPPQAPEKDNKPVSEKSFFF